MQGIEHYENFPVASWLCPAKLRPAVQALYRFARTADDLADEGDTSPELRLQQLAQYRQDLQTCWTNAQNVFESCHHADNTSLQWPNVFCNLTPVIAQHQLPLGLLTDLLDAFEQDVIYTRDGVHYATQAQLLNYCRRSANPVGRLLLHLYGVNNVQALQKSDAICTALQLINFWQDRVQDLKRKRNYLPSDSTWSEQLRFARSLMLEGSTLVHQLPGRAGWELRLVIQGGLRVLRKLESSNAHQDPANEPLTFSRPKINALDLPIMFWHALWM